MARTGRRRAPAFTLVELLVVIVIVLLVSAVALPTVLPALSHRQVSEAARILQAQLVQTRDTAIRYNAPRGVRFLPDPTYANSPSILASNRMIPLEPGPEYSNGMVTIWPVPNINLPNPSSVVPYPTPSAYPVATPAITSPVYPYYTQPNVPATVNPTPNGRVLMVEQAMFTANTVTTSTMLAPTSWYWNIRVGDKIQIGNEGQTYTVVGPCTVNPNGTGANQGNAELFVNVGQPGDTTNYLRRQYTDSGGNAAAFFVEHLYVVNSIDDGGLGYIDSGFDGIINWGMYGQSWMPTTQNNMVADSLFEWQAESWRGVLSQYGAFDATNTAYSNAIANSGTATGSAILAPTPYTIQRRPVPTQAAREVLLPNNVVIDMTTWNTTSERSRLPVDPFSKYVDIMLLPSGQVLPTTLYSSPASFSMSASFYHFWLSERQDVHELSDVWGLMNNPTPPPNQIPAPNPNTGLTFRLPMPQDAYTAYVSAGNTWTVSPPVALTGERMMVTLFSRTGQVTTNSIEFFDAKNVDTPFLDSQLAAREGK